MNNTINWEQISLAIITEAGSAKSSAIEALQAAKENDFASAKDKMAEANIQIANASHVHYEVIQQEAQGIQLEFKVLFMHAEDQLLTSQTLILLVGEMIEMYEKFGKHECKSK